MHDSACACAKGAVDVSSSTTCKSADVDCWAPSVLAATIYVSVYSAIMRLKADQSSCRLALDLSAATQPWTM